MGLPSAVRQAVKLSVVSSLLSAVFALFLPKQLESQVEGGYFVDHFIFYVGSFAVILSWELILHLHKVSISRFC